MLDFSITGEHDLVKASFPRTRAYTPGSTNIAVAGKWGPRIESMYFLLEMGIFQPAMLVYQRVHDHGIHPGGIYPDIFSLTMDANRTQITSSPKNLR